MKKTIRIESTIVPSRKEQLCELILKHHLHLRRSRLGYEGMMSWWARNPEYVELVVVAYDRARPIGAAMYVKSGWGIGTIRYGVYVKSTYRRNGIGSNITRAVKKRLGRNFLVSKHSKPAERFFNSLQLRAGYF